MPSRFICIRSHSRPPSPLQAVSASLRYLRPRFPHGRLKIVLLRHRTVQATVESPDVPPIPLCRDRIAISPSVPPCASSSSSPRCPCACLCCPHCPACSLPQCLSMSETRQCQMLGAKWAGCDDAPGEQKRSRHPSVSTPPGTASARQRRSVRSCDRLRRRSCQLLCALLCWLAKADRGGERAEQTSRTRGRQQTHGDHAVRPVAVCLHPCSADGRRAPPTAAAMG
jgi:hypothetical protein